MRVISCILNGTREVDTLTSPLGTPETSASISKYAIFHCAQPITLI